MKKIGIMAVLLCLGTASLEAMTDEDGVPVQGEGEPRVKFLRRLTEYREKKDSINPDDVRKLREDRGVEYSGVRDKIDGYNTLKQTKPVVLSNPSSRVAGIYEQPNSLPTDEVAPFVQSDDGALSNQDALDYARSSEEAASAAAPTPAPESSEEPRLQEQPLSTTIKSNESGDFVPSSSSNLQVNESDSYHSDVRSGGSGETKSSSGYDGSYSYVRAPNGKLQSTSGSGLLHEDTI
ncbi:MAG: hypothetical protein LBD81_02265 [Holosporaceae bacterium]|nr:hypothetical protein [Holosporaceae bacterium]